MKKLILDLERFGTKVIVESKTLIRVNGELFAINAGILTEMRCRKGDYEKFVKIMSASKGMNVLKLEDKPSCFQ